MVQAQPETEFRGLVEKLERIELQEGFLDPSSPEYFALLRGATQLANADLAEANAVRGMVHAFANNYPAAALAFESALRATRDWSLRHFIAQGFLRIGRYTRVQELVRAYGSPLEGFFTEWASLGMSSGAFATLAQYKAKAANDLHLQAVRFDNLIQPCADILKANELAETEVARILDLTGPIAAKRRPGLGRKLIDIVPFRDDALIQVLMHWPVSYDVAADMNDEFFDSLVSNWDPLPRGLAVSFHGRQ